MAMAMAMRMGVLGSLVDRRFDRMALVGQQLRHQGAREHANDGTEQADQVRRDQRFGSDVARDHPAADAEHDGQQGALRGRPLPVRTGQQRDEGARQRHVVGVLHHLVHRALAVKKSLSSKHT